MIGMPIINDDKKDGSSLTKENVLSNGIENQSDDHDQEPQQVQPPPLPAKTLKLKKYACSRCKFKCATSSDLCRHERIHENSLKQPKPFICSFQNCAFSTLRREHLVNHEKTHTSIESRLVHPCAVCSKLFSSRSVLNRHKKTSCSSTQRAKTTATSSGRTSQSVKNTKCDICSKVLSTIHKLKAHKKLHDKTLEFVCDVCGNLFVSKECLAKHTTLHKAKAFACEVCGKEFSRKDYLIKHRKTHSKVKTRVEYLCANCESGFHSSKELQEHAEICEREQQNELIFIPNYSQEVVITQVEEEKPEVETTDKQPAVPATDENIYCATLLFNF